MKTIKINFGEFIPSNFSGIVVFPDGKKEWYKEGEYHREDGPAIEYTSGLKYWYKEGNLHRIDGPAVEYINGRKEWWIEYNLYLPEDLSDLINSSFYLEKAKGQYNLEWLKFLTEEEIKEFPIIPGMKEDKEFKDIFEKLERIENK